MTEDLNYYREHRLVHLKIWKIMCFTKTMYSSCFCTESNIQLKYFNRLYQR